MPVLFGQSNTSPSCCCERRKQLVNLFGSLFSSVLFLPLYLKLTLCLWRTYRLIYQLEANSKFRWFYIQLSDEAYVAKDCSTAVLGHFSYPYSLIGLSWGSTVFAIVCKIIFFWTNHGFDLVALH